MIQSLLGTSGWLETFGMDRERRRKRIVGCRIRALCCLLMLIPGFVLAMLGWVRQEAVISYIPNSLLAGFGVLILMAGLIAGLEAEIEIKLLQILDRQQPL